jgi:hypothetical protein
VYAGVTRGISYGDFPREELRGGIGGPATESSSLFYFTPGGPLFKIGRARDTIYIYCYASSRENLKMEKVNDLRQKQQIFGVYTVNAVGAGRLWHVVFAKETSLKM